MAFSKPVTFLFLQAIIMTTIAGIAFGQATFTFTSFEVPATLGTDTNGGGANNSGLISGGYTTPAGDLAGFLYDGESFTDVVVPGSGSATNTTFGPTNYVGYLNNISNNGDAVGVYNNADGIIHGYIRRANGDVDRLPDPVAQTTVNFPLHINTQGNVVGYYTVDPVGEEENAYLYTNGSYTSLAYPDAMATNAQGINDIGQIVGIWFDTTDTPHGFLLAAGKYSTVEYPGADGTFLSGINNRGDLTGAYLVSGVLHGFYRSADGQFSTVDFPGSVDTAPFSINDNGLIAGSHDEFKHGFVAQLVPEPVSLLPMLIGLTFFGRGRRRAEFKTFMTY